MSRLSKLHIAFAISIFLFFPLAVNASVFPESFIEFRETVYLQNKTLPETTSLYTAAKQDIEESFVDADLFLALSRCEYLMGLSFKAEGRDGEAAAFFEEGIKWAERSLEICPTSEGYRLLGTNISFLCEVRRSYGLMNFGRIEENGKKALELDPDNLAAQYLIATPYIIAPWPLADVRKGAAILDQVITQNYLAMEKESLFGLYLMLEAACLKQRKNQEAQIWREKAAEIYPGNNFISLLMK